MSDRDGGARQRRARREHRADGPRPGAEDRDIDGPAKDPSSLESGGDSGARTRSLRLAKPALSQLSYIPKPISANGVSLHSLTSAGTWSRTKDLSFIRAAL